MPETVVLYEHSGNSVQVTTTDQPVRFLFVCGKPLNEPVAWYRPIIMNTQEDLKFAFVKDLRPLRGALKKHPSRGVL